MSTAEVIPWDAEQRNVLHALTRKRAEIAGLVEQTDLELQRLTDELAHVDATIRIFNPDVDIDGIRAKPALRRIALKGEITRPIFRALREAEAPMTTREITHRLLRERGLDPYDDELAAILIKRVRACLRTQKQRGLVRNAASQGGQQVWETAR